MIRESEGHKKERKRWGERKREGEAEKGRGEKGQGSGECRRETLFHIVMCVTSEHP